jgi:hypothetical protein
VLNIRGDSQHRRFPYSLDPTKGGVGELALGQVARFRALYME